MRLFWVLPMLALSSCCSPDPQVGMHVYHGGMKNGMGNYGVKNGYISHNPYVEP